MIVQHRDAKGDLWMLVVATVVLLGGASPSAAQTLGVVTGSVVDAADGNALIGDEVALNAPEVQGKGGLDYRLPRYDASISATAHYVDDCPVRYGPYVGPVEAYTLLDVRIRAGVPAVPGMDLNLTAKNVLGTEHREFSGASALGRMLITRLTYDL